MLIINNESILKKNIYIFYNINNIAELYYINIFLKMSKKFFKI